MRVLFTTQPAYGHFHPLAPLAHALQVAGHEVVVASGASFAAIIESSGLRGVPAGIDWQEADGGLIRAFPELAEHPGTEAGNAFVTGTIFARETARAAVPDLLEFMAHWRPDLVVRGTFEFGGLFAAEIHEVPHVTVQVAAHSVFEQNKRALHDGLVETGRELGVAVDEQLELLHRHLLLSFVPPSFQDPEFPLPSAARALRAPVVDSYADATTPAWLAGLPFDKTIYMTMGTVFTSRTDPYEAVLRGLADEPVNLILTVGHSRDPAEFGPQPPNVRIERYVPQSLLLPHCDLVITHGGFNTILASLAYGLPLVALPYSADQPGNARRCHDMGVALCIDYLDITPRGVAEAALEVLREPHYRTNAGLVRQEILGLPGIEHAVELLEALTGRDLPATSPPRTSAP